MSVHCVYNGPHMLPHSAWKISRFTRRRRLLKYEDDEENMDQGWRRFRNFRCIARFCKIVRSWEADTTRSLVGWKMTVPVTFVDGGSRLLLYSFPFRSPVAKITPLQALDFVSAPINILFEQLRLWLMVFRCTAGVRRYFSLGHRKILVSHLTSVWSLPLDEGRKILMHLNSFLPTVAVAWIQFPESWNPHWCKSFTQPPNSCLRMNGTVKRISSFGKMQVPEKTLSINPVACLQHNSLRHWLRDTHPCSSTFLNAVVPNFFEPGPTFVFKKIPSPTRTITCQKFCFCSVTAFLLRDMSYNAQSSLKFYCDTQ